MNSTNYIELRVYLKENVDMKSEAIDETASQLQDLVADFAADPETYPIFTQEVTYEIKTRENN